MVGKAKLVVVSPSNYKEADLVKIFYLLLCHYNPSIIPAGPIKPLINLTYLNKIKIVID